MWLYIPSNCVPESECSEKASVPHSSILGSTIAQFATWSGKPLPPASLSRLWKREPLIRRLSGLTCSPSTAQHGADAWISSLLDSRAKTCPLPESELALMAPVPACSSGCSTSRTIAVRGGSFWRTSQASLLPPPPLWTKPKGLSKNAPPPESWENWPTAGGMRSGSLFPRPTWAPVIAGSDGSALRGAWMTPTIQASKGVDYQRVRGKDVLILDGQAKLMMKNWPTPRSTDGSKGGPNQAGSKGDLMLPSAAAQFSPGSARPTPAARDFRSGKASDDTMERNSRPLNEIAERFSHPVLSTLDGRELSPTDRTLPRRLNPAFACWLMGWPIWWTNPGLTSCARSETALWRSKLQRRLRCLLDDLEFSREAA